MQQTTSQCLPEKKQVLVYLFGSLGDTLVAIPALRAVRRHFRDAELTLLQNIPASGGIVKASQVIPPDLIDSYLEYAGQTGIINKFLDFYRLRRELRRGNFQAAVYLIISERPSQSVARDKFFFRSCGISDFYGFNAFSPETLYPLNDQGFPAMTDSEAERKVARLTINGIASVPDDFRRPFLPFSASETAAAENWLAARGGGEAVRLVSFAPGCKNPSNAWRDENFAEIGRRLLAQSNCEILIVGGSEERQIAEKLLGEWNGGINAVGEFSIRESGALISLCDFHIGVDTGTTHLAAAVGTPCFALFHGRDNPGQWYPAGLGHYIIFHPVKCAGCHVITCPIPLHPCMKEISVESVWSNLQEFMLNLKENPDAPTRVVAV